MKATSTWRMGAGICAVALFAITGCSGEAQDQAESAGAQASNAVSTAASKAAPEASAASSSISSAASSVSSSISSEAMQPFDMPDEVGKTLQQAQDHVQDVSGNPLYVSFSDDALGKSRPQVRDKNWKVCTQSPEAGLKVNPNTQVRFEVVKLDENCP